MPDYAGRVRVGELAQDGCISQVIVQTPQVFHRVPCVSYKQLPEARLSYFVEKVSPHCSREILRWTVVLFSCNALVTSLTFILFYSVVRKISV